MDESVKGLTPGRLLDEFHRRALDTFLIVMAERPDLNRAMEWIMSGAFSFLAKPVELDRLEQTIDQGLANQAAYHQVVSMARDLQEANQALELEKAALREKSEQLHFLNELGFKLGATLEISQIVKRTAEALTRLVGADLVLFLAHFSGDDSPRLYSSRRLHPALAASLSDDLAFRFGFRTKDASGPVQVVNPRRNGRPLTLGPEHRLIVPLTGAGRKYGLLGAYFCEPPEIDRDRAALIENVAHQAAQALINGHRHEIALNLAARDPLTGLFNRRAFDEHMEREFRFSRRYQTDLSLIMMDLDRFKSVNDRYGHQAGDEVLKAVADIVTDTVRATDITARLGGEEFAVLLPNTREARALDLARRIQEQVRRTRIRLDDAWHTQTVSQGVSDSRSPFVESPADLIHTADQAMYQAKRDGRDTIRTASSDKIIIDSGKDDRYVCKQ